MPELEEEHDEDTRPPEEHMADVAAATLDRLAAMRCELWSLHRQLLLLGGYTYNTDTGQQLLGLLRQAKRLPPMRFARLCATWLQHCRSGVSRPGMVQRHPVLGRYRRRAYRTLARRRMSAWAATAS